MNAAVMYAAAMMNAAARPAKRGRAARLFFPFRQAGRAAHLLFPFRQAGRAARLFFPSRQAGARGALARPLPPPLVRFPARLGAGLDIPAAV